MRKFLGYFAVVFVWLGLLAAAFGLLGVIIAITSNSGDNSGAILLGAGITTVLTSGAVLMLCEISESCYWYVARTTRHDRIGNLEELEEQR
jgi:hypothetical protein